MELTGTRTISADRMTVWRHLNDAGTLKACIPGCQDLTGTPEDGFDAVVVQKVGPVKATFKGGVTLEDVTPPESYRLVGEGKGGVAGFARGAADVSLSEVAEGTQLDYAVDAQVGGKLAQLGNRVVGGFARKMADEFFTRFQTIVEDGETPEADTAAGDTTA